MREEGLAQGYFHQLSHKAARALGGVLSGSGGTQDVNVLVEVCHSLATPYVNKRLTKDRVLREALDLNTSDFAFDCIADLFSSAQENRFPHFQAYFAAYRLESMSEEEVLSHLRRLVFSTASHGIFRLYNEVDPTLGKILRNIKLALEHFTSLVIFERFGDRYLTPSEGNRAAFMTPLEIDEIELGLRRCLRGTENIPFMLGKLALFLQEQPVSSRAALLSSVGVVFRNIYMSPSDSNLVGLEDKLVMDELADVIHGSVDKVQVKMIRRYADGKKVDASLLHIYFEVIEKKLMLTLSGDGQDKGLREILSEYLEGMSDTDYQTLHKSRLEYLSRLAGDEVVVRLKRG